MDEFKRIVLYMAPRILGLMDRAPDSRTFGCCDRNYWHYKIHDVSNARAQEVSLFLALLYSHDFQGNVYYKKPVVKEWAVAAVSYWSKLLMSDGSVAEVYPFERSSCATAFSTFTALETLFILDRLDQGKVLREKVVRTGHWLKANVNDGVANQAVAAALAMYNVARQTEDDYFMAEADHVIDSLVAVYKKHACFMEYAGFDVGYTSITNSLLAYHGARAGYRSGLKECILDSQKRIDAETSMDGEYPFADKSRRTQFLYPYGFCAMGSPVFNKILKGVEANRIITPLWMDDRYCVPLATDYLKTIIHWDNGGSFA